MRRFTASQAYSRALPGIQAVRGRSSCTGVWEDSGIVMHRRLGLVSLTASLFTISLALLTACGNGPTTPPVTTSTATFSVASTTPATGANGVATTTAILITFSGPGDATTVNTTNIKLTGGDSKAVAGTVTYNATTYVATFTPTSALVDGTTYTLTVSGVTSSSGAAMTSAFTSTFITAPGTSSEGTVQFQATFFPDRYNSGSGQISVTTSGAITIRLTGALASASFSAQFCPAYNILSQQPYPCIYLGSVTTNAGGDATATTQFPQPGSWAGDFQLNSGSTAEYETDIAPASDAGGITQVYTAVLQPEATVNGKGDGSPAPKSPLASGSVTYSNGLLQFTMTGASPKTTYTSTESFVLGGSQTYALYNGQKQGDFTTNALGDVTFTVLQDGTAGDLFRVQPPSGAGYIGGFSVPAS
jgi:hypothetical protein